jgi:eukaryotic-like serine/threonine-protein kinase
MRDESVDEALAAADPGDPAGMPAARARVAGSLFGAATAGGLGRFTVLERLGAGGMGAVYAAYDPDLDRSVALKLVPLPASGREAALAEAKALARLSHPHVVPVYDVGSDGGHVYIVMELVRGETLERWAKGRPRSEVLDAYRQAGEALAAAHAVGLIHRDFKPSNAVVGRDGRVRVIDFGLACEAAADPGRRDRDRQPPGGTPRYMAPEQAGGAAVTAAADQYSFAVSLAEGLAASPGLAGAAGVSLPRWLEAVIARGRAEDPAARFSSMRELLRALGRDPGRLWRRRLAVAAASLLAGLAVLAAYVAVLARKNVCREGESRLALVWPAAERAAALARIAGMGVYGQALAPWLERELGDHARRWVSGHHDSCLAHRRGLQSGALLDRRMACLERGRAGLASVSAIVATADAKSLPEVALAVRALPDPDACGDLQALLSGVAPPAPARAAAVADARARVEGARVQVAAGRYQQAKTAAEAAAAEARALGYRPLLAEALLVAGQARMALSARAEAVPALAEAATVAVEVGADALAIEAWARRAWAQGTSGDGAAALAGLEIVEALAVRNPSARFARALLHNNVGGVELALDHRQRARESFARALQEAQGVVGPGAVELVNVRINLGLTEDDPVVRDRWLAGAEDEMTALLGPAHPETLKTRWIRGAMTVPLDRAVGILAPTCEGLERHEGQASRTVECWAEVGFIDKELGDDEGARAATQRALRAGAETLPGSPEVGPYLLLWQGEAGAAADRFAAALAARPPRPEEPVWSRRKRAELQLGLGRARLAAGAARAAWGPLRASVAGLTEIERAHPSAYVRRRLNRARAELAVSLAASGGPPDESAALAGSAAAWLRAAGGRSAELGALERIAAAGGGR